MPLYDCMLLLKPHLDKGAKMDLVARIGKHVLMRNGVVTNIKSFGTINLGYGIKKLDGRYYKAHMMQMTMMATPNLNKELHYLNKEDRLLRWLLVKSRDTKYGLESQNEDIQAEFGNFSRKGLYGAVDIDEADEDNDSDDDDE